MKIGDKVFVKSKKIYGKITRINGEDIAVIYPTDISSFNYSSNGLYEIEEQFKKSDLKFLSNYFPCGNVPGNCQRTRSRIIPSNREGKDLPEAHEEEYCDGDYYNSLNECPEIKGSDYDVLCCVPKHKENAGDDCKENCIPNDETKVLQNCEKNCGNYKNPTNVELPNCKENCYTTSTNKNALPKCKIKCGDYTNHKSIDLPNCEKYCWTTSETENALPKCKNFCGKLCKDDINKDLECFNKCKKYWDFYSQNYITECKFDCNKNKDGSMKTKVKKNAFKTCIQNVNKATKVAMPKCKKNCITSADGKYDLDSCESNCGVKNNPKNVPLPNCIKDCWSTGEMPNCKKNCLSSISENNPLKNCEKNCGQKNNPKNILLPNCKSECYTTSKEDNALINCKENCGTWKNPTNSIIPECEKDCYTNNSSASMGKCEYNCVLKNNYFKSFINESKDIINNLEQKTKNFNDKINEFKNDVKVYESETYKKLLPKCKGNCYLENKESSDEKIEKALKIAFGDYFDKFYLENKSEFNELTNRLRYIAEKELNTNFNKIDNNWFLNKLNEDEKKYYNINRELINFENSQTDLLSINDYINIIKKDQLFIDFMKYVYDEFNSKLNECNSDGTCLNDGDLCVKTNNENKERFICDKEKLVNYKYYKRLENIIKDNKFSKVGFNIYPAINKNYKSIRNIQFDPYLNSEWKNKKESDKWKACFNNAIKRKASAFRYTDHGRKIDNECSLYFEPIDKSMKVKEANDMNDVSLGKKQKHSDKYLPHNHDHDDPWPDYYNCKYCVGLTENFSEKKKKNEKKEKMILTTNYIIIYISICFIIFTFIDFPLSLVICILLYFLNKKLRKRNKEKFSEKNIYDRDGKESCYYDDENYKTDCFLWNWSSN